MRLLACALVLSACAPEAPPEPSAPMAAPTWAASADGARLELNDTDGASLLALSCANRTMTAIAPGFEEIASEERFSLGADDQVFILVAQLGQPHGVRAEGAPAEDFLNRLPSANSVHANYGAQNLGPLPPPSPDQARGFAQACR
jgi:hypothetical protein